MPEHVIQAAQLLPQVVASSRSRGDGADRYRVTLEKLLAIEAIDIESALDQAADILVSILGADKVDAFLYDKSVDTLVAFGRSLTPLGERQRSLGLDRLQVSNGGRIVEVFQTGEAFITGRLDEDPVELPGVKGPLGVRSKIAVLLVVGEESAGVLSAASTQEHRFSKEDLRFLQVVAKWVGLIARRGQLMEEAQERAVEEASRATAAHLVALLVQELSKTIAPAMERVSRVRSQAQNLGTTGSTDTTGSKGNVKHKVNDGSTANVSKRLHEDANAAYLLLQQAKVLMADHEDVSRIERGLVSFRHRQFNLTTLVEQAVRLLHTARAASAAANGADANIVVRMPQEMFIRADYTRIGQAIENLLALATEDSSKGALILVEATTELHDDGQRHLFTVRYRGGNDGRALEALPKVVAGPTDVSSGLRPGASGDGRVQGRGLGVGVDGGLRLFLVQRIAEAHGGSLRAETSARDGSLLCLELPVEPLDFDDTV